MMTQAQINRLEATPKPKMYNVAPTLYIRVTPNGTKQWVQRFVQNGIRTDRGLGSFPYVGIEEAKRKAREQHVGVKQGEVIPTQQKEKVKTFDDVNQSYMEMKRLKNWKRNPVKKTQYWQANMQRYASKLFTMPIEDVTGEDIQKVLNPMYQVKPHMAETIRKNISAVMEYAINLDYRKGRNPVKAIKGYLPTVKDTHFKAVDHSEVKDVLAKIDETDTMQEVTKEVLRFVIFTACRPGEAINATWDEINLDERTWTVQGDKMKAGELHRVALSEKAIEVLNRIASKTAHNGSQLIFSNRGGLMSSGTLAKALKRLGVGSVAHGFRSSFKTWGIETGQNNIMLKLAMAHSLNKVERAYTRTDMLEQRRPLMEAWADYLK